MLETVPTYPTGYLLNCPAVQVNNKNEGWCLGMSMKVQEMTLYPGRRQRSMNG